MAPPKGWQRSVWNEQRINEIVREQARGGCTGNCYQGRQCTCVEPMGWGEFAGEFCAAFCVIALPIALLFIAYVWGV